MCRKKGRRVLLGTDTSGHATRACSPRTQPSPRQPGQRVRACSPHSARMQPGKRARACSPQTAPAPRGTHTAARTFSQPHHAAGRARRLPGRLSCRAVRAACQHVENFWSVRLEFSGLKNQKSPLRPQDPKRCDFGRSAAQNDFWYEPLRFWTHFYEKVRFRLNCSAK